jgi:hypothetical protein
MVENVLEEDQLSLKYLTMIYYVQEVKYQEDRQLIYQLPMDIYYY